MANWWHTPGQRRHTQVMEALRLLYDQGAQIMASAAELTALLARVDAATSRIADDIRRIKEQLAGGLTADEATTIQAQLEQTAARLDALDAENPDGEVPQPPES